MPKVTAQQVLDAKHFLLDICQVTREQGVVILHRHTSRSGMMRCYDVYAVVGGQAAATSSVHPPELYRITRSVAYLCGYSTNNEGQIKIGGCGFAADYEIAADLYAALWGYKETVSERPRYQSI